MNALLIVILMLATTVFAEEVTSVHVQVGKVSEVSFPENIAQVIKGGASDSILVEVMDNSLFILPKTEAPSDVFVKGVSGKSYPINLKVSTQHDLNVVVNGNSVNSSKYQSGISAIDIMKILLQGNEPAGAVKIKVQRQIVLENSPITLDFELAYDFPQFRVYGITARNKSDRRVNVPLDQLSLENIIAAASLDDVLAPEGQARDHTTIFIIQANERTI